MCKSYLIIDRQGATVAWCCAKSRREALSWIPAGYQLESLPSGFERSKYHRATHATYRSAPCNQSIRSQPVATVRRGVTTRLSLKGVNWLDSQPSASAAIASLIEAAASK